MPLYEYRCKDCGAEFEKSLRFSEADQIPVCPKCKSENTRKKISAVISFGSNASDPVSRSSSNCGTSSGFT